jgi:hypothetical protein
MTVTLANECATIAAVARQMYISLRYIETTSKIFSLRAFEVLSDDQLASTTLLGMFICFQMILLDRFLCVIIKAPIFRAIDTLPHFMRRVSRKLQRYLYNVFEIPFNEKSLYSEVLQDLFF